MIGDPHNDPNAQGDAFKTLFVARVVSRMDTLIFSSVLTPGLWIMQIFSFLTADNV